MKLLSIIKHMFVVLAGALLLVGIPFCTTDYCKALGDGEADALASATVVIEQPSGAYVVFINRDMHPDEENRNTWIRFFEGEEISYLFEDIACDVIAGDTGALTMAQSFQSRLPERQMSVRKEDATLLMSRADRGKYDILILSQEFAQSYDVSTIDGESAIRIEIFGGAN